MQINIVIPGDAIAKKNSQRIVKMGRVHSIRPSAAYDKWAKQAMQELQLLRIGAWPGDMYPVELRFFFYRATNRKFDISNLVEGPQDVLQKAGILADDSMRHVIPVIDRRAEGYGWAIDRDCPRTEISIRAI